MGQKSHAHLSTTLDISGFVIYTTLSAKGADIKPRRYTMASLYSRPTNITGFRKIKVAHRKGQTPESMLSLHESRKEKDKLPKPMSVMAIFRSNSKPKNVRTIQIGDINQFDSIPVLQRPRVKIGMVMHQH